MLVLRLILNKGVQRFHGEREREKKQKELLTHTDIMLLSALVKAAKTSNLLYPYVYALSGGRSAHVMAKSENVSIPHPNDK